MTPEQIAARRQELSKLGSVFIDYEDAFLTKEEFDALEDLAENLPREHIETGDAGEPNFLDVGRFMTDVDMPELVNRPSSDKAVEILGKPELLKLYQELLDTEELCLRRMQYNILSEGSFVGYHLDRDSNPDYIAAIIIQFGTDFEGGDYVVYGGDMPPRSFSPKPRSIGISRCEFPHEVTKVKKGKRKSLVFFVSENCGHNRRPEVEAAAESATVE